MNKFILTVELDKQVLLSDINLPAVENTLSLSVEDDTIVKTLNASSLIVINPDVDHQSNKSKRLTI